MLQTPETDKPNPPQPTLSGAPTRAAVAPMSGPAPSVTKALPPVKRSFFDRVEAYISRLSTRNNFWHRVTSLIWLPFAFRSGIKMKRLDSTTFTAILPFRRFNKNWYNAMAGAALLGNSEIAGGMYVFGICGGEYTVVCKHLEYRFLRPCFGPAIYRIQPREDIRGLTEKGEEFNITLDLEVFQGIIKATDKERRVGKCTATFHATPKVHHKRKRLREGEQSGAPDKLGT